MKLNPQCRHRTWLGLWIMLSAMWAMQGANAATLTVTNLADSGPGTLREAVAAGASGDRINFEPSLSGQSILLTSGQLTISNSITIDASGMSERIVVSGNNASRVFHVSSGVTSALHHLIVCDGRTPNAPAGSVSSVNRSGAGIRNYGALTLSNCHIVANQTGSGGPPPSSGPGGFPGDGAGIYTSGTLLLVSCLIASNITGNGGDSFDSRPGAGGDGAGLFCASGSITVIRDSTVVSNATGVGGKAPGYDLDGGSGSGIAVQYGSFFSTNCTIGANRLGTNGMGHGGGIWFASATVRLVHCTIAGNDGAGIYRYSGAQGAIALENSMVTGNSGDSNIHGAVTAFIGSNITNGNSLLAPLGKYGGLTPTMPPLPGSPAIDAAILTPDTPALDQRGSARPNGALPDVGAVEAFAFSSLMLADTDNDGIDDRLESAYGLVVGNDDSAVDSDGDGYTDAAELFSMTNPLDANDHLRILDIAPTPAFNPSTNPLVSVTLSAFPGLEYVWESGAALTNFQAMSNGQFTATNSIHMQEVLLAPDRDFLRVRRMNP